MTLGNFILFLTVPFSALIGAYAGRNRQPELLVAWCLLIVAFGAAVIIFDL